MKVVIWARVSSREQREGYSIDAQLRFCRAKAQREGWTVVKEFAVAESAKRGAERVVFNEMYDWVRRNARKERLGLVLSHKLDRVCRNIRDAVRMQELEDTCGVKLAFVDNEFGPGAAGALSFNVMAAVAQYYSDNLRTEVLKGRNEKAEQGWLPAGAPYGYMNVKDRDKPIQPHPSESKTVVRMFELYSRGDTTFKLLADRLLREGHVYRPAYPRFTPTAVSYILNNRFYIGQFRWHKKEWRPGRHEPLIDVATFQRCQALLSGRTRRLAKPDLPLAYRLFRCEHCGRLITGERVRRRLKGGGVREHLYYRCANNNPGPDHPVVRWRAEELDEAIAEDLGTMCMPTPEIAAWFSQALHDVFHHEAQQRDRQQTILTRRRTELTSTKDRLVRAFVSGALDEGTLKAQTVEIDAQLSEVNRGLEAGGDIDESRGDIAAKLFDWTQNAAADWRGSKIARRRLVLEAISLNRRLSATSLCLEKRRPFRELAERPSIQLNRGERI